MNLLDVFDIHSHQIDLIVLNKGNTLEFISISSNSHDPKVIADIQGIYLIVSMTIYIATLVLYTPLTCR